MELVYLWVEKYKNIKNQGFNFSPRFDCKYDKDSNELIIDEKKDYISIFPDNINVTAIVGENGSGKSSIINQIRDTNYITITLYIIKGDYFIVTNVRNIKCNKKYKEKLKNSIDFSYLDSNIINTANIIDFRSYMSPIDASNEINKFKGGGNESHLFDFNKYQQEFYKSLLTLYKEKIHLKFNYQPNRIILSFFNNKVNKENLEELELLIRLESNQRFKGDIQTNGYCIEEFMNVYIKNNEELFFKLVECDAIKIMLYDKKNRNMLDLSHGERKQYVDMIFVYESILGKNDNIIVLLDEPDIGIHPNWQNKYISELINIFKHMDKKLHFIITSHSPFIISDIPQENVIFLENGEQKYPFKDKQTFGANIHTLLSDGFFMQDGLMGEFAKGKIQEIKKFYELVKRFEEKDFSSPNSKSNLKHIFLEQKTKFRYIQSIIGEPFLQTVIKNYLDELEVLFNGKKQFIQDEIKRLQELESSL